MSNYLSLTGFTKIYSSAQERQAILSCLLGDLISLNCQNGEFDSMHGLDKIQ